SRKAGCAPALQAAPIPPRTAPPASRAPRVAPAPAASPAPPAAAPARPTAPTPSAVLTAARIKSEPVKDGNPASSRLLRLFTLAKRMAKTHAPPQVITTL